MPFYINARFLQEENLTGVGRFGLEIARQLLRLFPNTTLLAPRNIPPKWLRVLPIQQWGKLHGWAWEQMELPIFLGREKKLLLNLANTCPLLGRRNVTVFHDLIPLSNPEWYSRQARLYFRALLPLSAYRSSHIFAVSRETRRALIDRLHVPEENISISHPAAGDFWYSDTDSSNREGKYILGVSSLDPRKNFGRLIEAFLGLQDDTLKLIIVGHKHKAFSDVGIEVPPHLASRIIFKGYLEDEALRVLYSHAAAFIFPSLKEGFGIPPLEAMRCGCPVIASDIPVLREICGDAPFYFNPYDVLSLRAGISKVLSNQDLRRTMIAEGYARAQQFSWDKTAEAMALVLHRLQAQFSG